MIEGWALPLVKHKIPYLKNSLPQELVYEPKEISFRVNLNSLIGSGYWMNCYHAQVIMNNDFLNMVAKRDRWDLNNNLEFYLKQSQLYFHAREVLSDFQKVIRASSAFGKEDKALIAPLRVSFELMFFSWFGKGSYFSKTTARLTPLV